MKYSIQRGKNTGKKEKEKVPLFKAISFPILY